MKRNLLCVIAVVLALCLAACGGKESKPELTATISKPAEEIANMEAIAQRIEAIADKTGGDNAAAPAEAPTETATEAPAAKDGPEIIDATGNLFSDGTMSDSLNDMEFILDNVMYCLPLAYEEMVNFGWTGEQLEDQLLEAREEKWIYMTKDDCTIAVGVYNLSNTPAPLNECDIIGIEVNADDLEGMTFCIAKGINLSSTWQEVAEAFGDDVYVDEREEDDTAVDFLYQVHSNYTVEISIDNEHPEDNSITLYFELS